METLTIDAVKLCFSVVFPFIDSIDSTNGDMSDGVSNQSAKRMIEVQSKEVKRKHHFHINLVV